MAQNLLPHISPRLDAIHNSSQTKENLYAKLGGGFFNGVLERLDFLIKIRAPPPSRLNKFPILESSFLFSSHIALSTMEKVTHEGWNFEL